MDSVSKNNNFNTIDAIIASILAFRANNNTVVRISDTDNNIVSNKEQIAEFLKQGVVHTDELLKEAELIQTGILQRVTLNTLTGKLNNDFLLSVSKVIEKSEIKLRDVGIVAWAPKIFADNLNNDNIKERLSQLGIYSDYIGKVKDKVSFELTVISVKYLQNYNIFAHYGQDEKGNIVSFISKNKMTDGQVSARIKDTRIDGRINNAKVTVLHYVKEI